VLAAAPRRYALSFTTGALLTREAVLLAPVYVEQRDWEQVRDLAVKENLLQARTHRTGVRLASETVQRLSVLADDEVEGAYGRCRCATMTAEPWYAAVTGFTRDISAEGARGRYGEPVPGKDYDA
jgi:Putative inner membrane protein (DUF1819)